MAKKAKKKKSKKLKFAAKGNAYYFLIKCNYDGLIVGAHSPDEDLDGRVKNMSHIKLKDTAAGVVVQKIQFEKDDDHAPCVWQKINGQWKCV